MNVIGAVVAGLIGTAVFSMVMWLGPRMGIPRMAIWELLGSMFAKDGNWAFGWIAHFMMGTIFAIIYAALWGAGLGSANAGSGALFGIVHWLAVGLAIQSMSLCGSSPTCAAITVRSRCPLWPSCWAMPTRLPFRSRMVRIGSCANRS